MKKGLIVGGVLIIGVIIFMTLGSSADDEIGEQVLLEDMPKTAEVASSIVSEDGTYIGSFLGLMDSGKAWKCTNSYSMEGMVTSGTAYIYGDNVYAVYSSNISMMGEMLAYVLTNETTIYSWSNLSLMGYEAPRTEEGAQSDTSNDSVDLSEDFEYSCTPWDVDMTIFTLPEEITFEEIPTE